MVVSCLDFIAAVGCTLTLKLFSAGGVVVNVIGSQALLFLIQSALLFEVLFNARKLCLKLLVLCFVPERRLF